MAVQFMKCCRSLSLRRRINKITAPVVGHVITVHHCKVAVDETGQFANRKLWVLNRGQQQPKIMIQTPSAISLLIVITNSILKAAGDRRYIFGTNDCVPAPDELPYCYVRNKIAAKTYPNKRQKPQ